ncbi:ABC transporter permease [Alloscardovia theropitheci]|uniref:ABC transporter permease n=2 Tax=Alloscardovia theropitheci TaxID=2496842 RepID=A0A4V2MU55_9BIFI|nr:ABC transporter permease [Alloscardovia theropitheci]TCD55019.1 ABC transporter permease [Alloscardovia theropitheci]
MNKRMGIILKSLLTRWDGLIASIFCMLWIAVSIISLVWTPYALTFTDGYNVWSAPSSSHILGTDGAGADVFSWLMAGSATELLIVCAVAVITAVCGVSGVAVSVSRNSGVRGISVVTFDALISIPIIVIALLCAAPWGASIVGVIIACSFAYSLNLMRVVRPSAITAVRSPYVTFARYKGISEFKIFWTHILPQIIPSVIINVSFASATAILAESGLTYLGVGVPSHIASWGRSLSTAANFVTIHPSVALWPGVIITVAVIMINLLGDALRESIDPLTNAELRRS